ncbi:MAG: hypothetical protein WCA79_00255, partial [Anaerolineales bacterium]
AVCFNRLKGDTMNPQDDISKEQGQTEIVNLQEQFGNGLQDRSLPAAQVLVEQTAVRDSNERAPLYVP